MSFEIGDTVRSVNKDLKSIYYVEYSKENYISVDIFPPINFSKRETYPMHFSKAFRSAKALLTERKLFNKKGTQEYYY